MQDSSSDVVERGEIQDQLAPVLGEPDINLKDEYIVCLHKTVDLQQHIEEVKLLDGVEIMYDFPLINGYALKIP